MAERATPEGLELAKEKSRRFSNQKVIADLAEVSRATVNKFFTGKPISVDCFRAICKTLELDWEEIADLNGSKSEPTQSEHPKPSDINAWVQNLREQIQPYIPLLLTLPSVFNCCDLTKPAAFLERSTQSSTGGLFNGHCIALLCLIDLA